jgi:putative oxidoreductase
MSNKRTIAYWILAGLPALVFLFGSYLKLTGAQFEIDAFKNFGYSLSFMYFIGVCELLGALGLLLGQVIDKRLPRLASVCLLMLLVGILYTHAIHPPLLASIPAIVLTSMLGAFLWLTKSGEASQEISV